MADDESVGAVRTTGPRAVCVGICTRNRGDAIVSTLESVIAAADTVPSSIEILVVDQSANEETRRAVREFVERGEVRYISTNTVGLSRARNLLLAETDADLVLFTDDDCMVAPDWITATVAEFGEDRTIAVVFGDVEAAPGGVGSITPVSIAPSPYVVTSLRAWKAVDGIGIGIGASMAVDRDVALSVGGFDPLLGAGGRFHSGEDTDFAVRVLLDGHAIRRSTKVRVLHAGHRTSDEFRALTRHAMFGVGCALSKAIRRSPGSGSLLVARIVTSSVLSPGLSDLAHRRRPRVLGRGLFLLRGLVGGLQVGVDRSTWCFVDQPEDRT